MRFFSSKKLLLYLTLPVVLTAESFEEPANTLITDEQLLKSSFIELENQFESNKPEEIEQPIQKKDVESQPLTQTPDFLSQLQANAGNLNFAQPGVMSSQGANTWVPKFVWLGDIKKNDELKCFAAFLIGSLSGDDQNGEPMNPGVFMTPVTTNSPTANAAASTSVVPTQINHQNIIAKKTPASTAPSAKPDNSIMYTELQIGLGFLQFAGFRGSYMPSPTNLYEDISEFANSVPNGYHVFGRIEHTNTPVYTFDFGWNWFRWLSFAATMQAQQNIHIRTRPLQFANLRAGVAPNTGEAQNLGMVMFQSNLDLYSIGGKLTFTWPEMIRYYTWSMSLYLAGSCSGGWQSWKRAEAVQTYFNNANQISNTLTSANISFRDKTFANFVYTGDSGLVFKPLSSLSKMSIRFGCKFTGWGSARRIGKLRDQKDIRRLPSTAIAPQGTNFNGPAVYPSYVNPLRIRTIYSWTPYVGVNWEF